jgi:hypothetical protein
MRAAYGFDDIRQNESLIHIAEDLVFEMAESAVPGRFLVNYFTPLKYIPPWFPGAGFKKHFRKVAQMSFEALYPPFEEAKRDVVSTFLLSFLVWGSQRVISGGRKEE